MKRFDVLVAGGGTGRDILLAAEAKGLKAALVERGPLGGTCHNRGCMPSKMLIHSADVAETVRSGGRFGVAARIDGIDFPSIVGEVYSELDAETAEREEALRESPLVKFYRTEGRFTGPNSMELAGGEEISAERVFILGGTRPTVPPIQGVENVPHVTSDEALHLDRQPRRLVIIGGGYIAAEMAHFFGSLGTRVTVLVRGDRMLDREDGEISEWFSREFRDKHDVRLGAEAEQLTSANGETEVRLKGSGESIPCDLVLFATGRRPNTDLWNVSATGVELTERGYIRVNEFMETSVDNVWAMGDIVGVMELKHVAVRQARHVARNVFDGERTSMDYRAIPHAVFSSPQVAAVGLTEDQLRRASMPYKTGRWEVRNTGMGMALKENGLVKVLADPETGEILGCHIVGPHASILIQEAVVAMNTTGKLSAVTDSVHAHPALPQAVEYAFNAAAAA